MADPRVPLTDGERRRAFVSMLVLVPLAGAATDIYVPSLPAMVDYFHASELDVQATLLVYMAFYGAGQIIAGPLTDTLGRRWPTLFCTLVFVAASVGIALAPPLWVVVALRGVQGIFGACSAVGGRAIVADCYEGADRHKATNWMTIAWATGPILSPVLGGYLQSWFGWTASFWVLAGWGAVVVALCLFVLPDTRKTRPVSELPPAFAVYGAMVRDSVYLFTAIGMACLASVMYGFECLAPFYIQHELGHDAVFYGHIQAALGALWLTGNFFNRFVSTRVRVIRVITTAAGTGFLISALMLVLDLRGVFDVSALAVPAGIIYFLMATIWPNGYAKCYERFPHAGGSANALVSGLFIVVSAAFMLAASVLQSKTAWPMWLLYSVVTAAALFIFAGVLRKEFNFKVS